MAKTHQQIKQALEQILATQYADGERRQEQQSSIWGGSGGDVKRAVSYAEEAIRDPLPDETPLQYIESLVERINEQHRYYKDIESDRDGYGNGTFKEILYGVNALLASVRRD